MTTSPTTATFADPASRSLASWQGRNAALCSRGVADDDPRRRECASSLSYWRLRRQLDAEVSGGNISASFADVIADRVRLEAMNGTLATGPADEVTEV